MTSETPLSSGKPWYMFLSRLYTHTQYTTFGRKLNLSKMGIQNYYGNLKEKFSTRLKRKEEEPAKPIAHPPRMHNLGEEIRLLVHSQSFEKAYNTAAPFLFASLGAWPGYWLFRGMDYHVHRSHIPLPIYIRQVSRLLLRFAINF